jgi:hypothetical protein
MALTESRLNMSAAVHAIADMDTTKAARILTAEGENYATHRLVDMMRASRPDRWAALVLLLHRCPKWSDYEAAELRQARHLLREAVAA